MTITNYSLFLTIWGYIVYIAISLAIICCIILFFRDKKTYTDLSRLQIERKIYAFGFIESIIFWYGTVLIYGSNNSSLINRYGDYIESLSYLFIGYFCIIGVIIFAMLFLHKSNQLYGEDYINVRGFTTGVKYGLYMLIGSILVPWSIFLVISSGDYNSYIFNNIWANPVTIQTVLIVLSTIFLINGTLVHKMDYLDPGVTRNIIYSVYSISIFSFVLMANTMNIVSSYALFLFILFLITIVYIYSKIFKLGLLPTRFLIGIYIIFFILFIPAILVPNLGHGRFLFFGLNRKPRKAVIKDSNNWFIKY